MGDCCARSVGPAPLSPFPRPPPPGRSCSEPPPPLCPDSRSSEVRPVLRALSFPAPAVPGAPTAPGPGGMGDNTSPISVILVSSGSRGNKLLFRYPFQRSQEHPASQTSKWAPGPSLAAARWFPFLVQGECSGRRETSEEAGRASLLVPHAPASVANTSSVSLGLRKRGSPVGVCSAWVR